ncbi:MAG TPA: phage holin family protein [Cyclobacteriaceae bacterium]|nr:phage holin family protein [Cyclobacteriaceae bacterium]
MIKETILKFLKLDGLVNNLTGYVESRMELLKYELKEDLARGLAKVCIVMLAALLFTFFLIFISVAVAFKLSESMGEFAGFGIVGGFYLVLLLTIVLCRNPISQSLEKKLKNLIIQK